MQTRSAARNRSGSSIADDPQLTTDHPEMSVAGAVPFEISHENNGLQPLEHSKRSIAAKEQAALLRLSLLTTVVWLCAIFYGISRNDGLPPNREELPFQRFDRILRIAGPLIPAGIMALRYLAFAPVYSSPETADAGVGSSGSSGGSGGGLSGIISGDAFRQLTAGLGLAAMYVAVTVVRWGIYMLHVLLAPTILSSWKRPGSLTTDLMSDHIFLGASIVAILTAEGHQLAAYARSWQRRSAIGGVTRPGVTLHRRLVIAAMVVWTLLISAICTDMHTTARHFHEPKESIVAAVAGAVVFQVPMTLYLWSRTTVA